MRARTKTLFENNSFLLIQHSHPKKDSKYFTIRAKHYSVKDRGHFNSDHMEELRDHFDPAKNRGSERGYTWKFKNRKEAEQLITIALIKWS